MSILGYREARLIEAIMAEVAQAQIMPRFDGSVLNGVREKTSTFDVVTDADEAAEREISKRLRAAFPGAAIIGEEAAERDPTLIAQIASADLAFILDPIDGTKNFSSGVPAFGVMLAATVRGEVVFGAIHDPVCNDTSMALRGEGAWRQGGERAASTLNVAAPAAVGDMHGVAGSSFLPEPLRSAVARNLSRVGMTFWMRCAAHEYRMAAAGHCHFLVYNRLKPWDHAAGWLIHREAGGFSAHIDGTPYRPEHLSGGLICAPDRASWEQLKQTLFTL